MGGDHIISIGYTPIEIRKTMTLPWKLVTIGDVKATSIIIQVGLTKTAVLDPNMNNIEILSQKNRADDACTFSGEFQVEKGRQMMMTIVIDLYGDEEEAAKLSEPSGKHA